MTSQLHTRNNITSQENSVLMAPTQEMFKSRPFVVQSKQDKLQQSNLNKSLMQAENYGHHLDQVHPASTKPEVMQMARKNY
jgi:hypothetical protein